ncbi:hypothetical protein AU255_14785 [Methyloprofundus sedimenti]|uniref:DUF2750 domain-containing protein n=1 Tax=Methyloprofundus sedimenti TaxID=1420851 RepID=A0A1V8M1P9_9GAMM|nr:DUF2750 domain-containing protein [Methyloprofundus sedimenti]OQK15491.1 hypothetical protein AU255_14785 [Methyloprofundus sedimenti]
MRYEPYEDEYAAVPNMTDAELLEYFLYRFFETEEIWGLKENAFSWVTREINGQVTQPIWPYKRYANEAAVGDWEGFVPVAESLEFFLETSLHQLVAQDVLLEVMPRKFEAGCLISAQRLCGIMEGMMESGEYTLDG